MHNIFTKILNKPVQQSTFDLSHDIKTSFKMGQLIPTTVLDVVPGDRFKISVENMLRFTPLIAPIMHKVTVKTNYFFVPNRLLWAGWEDFITGESTDAPPTFVGLNSVTEGDLGDYMGVPTDMSSDNGTMFNALPFAAYSKIWNDYYRDQNLDTELTTDTLVTGDNSAIKTFAGAAPLHRRWEHDYFTSCLPFAQKGTAVTLPLTSAAQIDVTLKGPGNTPDPIEVLERVGHAAASSNPLVSVTGEVNVGVDEVVMDPKGSLQVDINAEAVEINDLRTAFSVQQWLEKNARAGSRYIEVIKAHFNVKSSDSRLDRPEYIGGSSQNMIISQVLSTAQTENATNPEVPIGEMAGHGISVGGGNTFSYTAEEHGWIIGLISVMPQTAYQQGIAKMFSRPTYQDYLWPLFANLGEQAVLNKEVYADYTPAASRENTFGYIPRFAEYRFMNSRVSGLMKTDLSFWHLGRIFTANPMLNTDFVKCTPDDRIFTTIGEDSTDHIIAHIFNNIRATRKLPKYAVPSGL